MGLFDHAIQEQQAIADLSTQLWKREISLKQKLTSEGWYAVYIWECEWYISPILFDFVIPIDFTGDLAKLASNFKLYRVVESNVKGLLHDDLSEGDSWYGHIVCFEDRND